MFQARSGIAAAAPHRFFAWFAVGLAFCSVAGWALGIPALTKFVADRPSLSPMTAVMLTVGALAAMALPNRNRTALGLAGLGTALGLAIVAAHATGLPAASSLRFDWWSSKLTGSLFAFSALACVLLAAGQIVAGQIWALLVLLFAGLVGLGHVFPTADLYSFMPGTGVAIPTVLGFLALSASQLLACPRHGVVGALTSRNTMGRYGRLLLIAGVASVLFMAALVITVRRSVELDAETAIVLLAWGAVGALGATLWALAVAVDRAEAARAQAERERDEMRQLVAAAVTHDLRNPLQAATVSATLLKRQVEGPQADLAMQRLQRSHRRLDRLLRSLLDTLTLESGRSLRLHASEFALEDLVAEVVAENEAVLGARVAWEGRATGWWDRDALYRVIENLLLNAAKYGEPASAIWCRMVRITAKHVDLTVENHGAPIDATDRQTIFQPFGRGQATRNSEQAGWGIGLAFARSVAQGHGGSLELLRSDEHSTVFALYLPVDARPSIERAHTG